jgi:hypothetical protein
MVGWLGRLVVLIGIATVLAGAVQMIRPAFVLGIVGADASAASRYFFGIVGMFMVLFGGLALHGVRVKSAPALLWAGLQKFGASAAVALGVVHGIFAPIALGVAGFDLVSGVVIMLYWRYVAAASN